MMSDTALQIAVCSSCGAEVRDQSLFCYNCGTKVIEDSPAAEVAEPVTPEPSAAPPARPPLKSAAELRKQRRALSRQPVEVSWETPSRSPIGFVITTIILTLAALVFLLLALYLR